MLVNNISGTLATEPGTLFQDLVGSANKAAQAQYRGRWPGLYRIGCSVSVEVGQEGHKFTDGHARSDGRAFGQLLARNSCCFPVTNTDHKENM